MTGKKKKEPPTPWEIAKPILTKLYLDGTITDAMKPKDVYALQPEFSEIKYVNFRTNFANLKKSIRKNRERAESDEAGYLNDIAIYPLAKDTPGYWDGSEAQRLLKLDINNKRHEQMKPKYLWLSRPEYQAFGLSKFRGHIHQELRSTRETNYWIIKRKKKEKAETARKKGVLTNDEDVDYLFDDNIAGIKSVQQ